MYSLNSSPPLKKSSHRQEFVNGLNSALPICLGYIPVAVTFAIISQTQGIPNFIIILMSVLVFAGASQFAAVGMLSTGSIMSEIILATFVLNLRHLIFSASLSRRLEKDLGSVWAALIAFGVTDESFATASLQACDILPRYYLIGLNFAAYAAWVGGTGAGLFLSTLLPQLIKNSLGIALYALFIGLLIPAVRISRPAGTVMVLALATSSILFWVPGLNTIPTGWRIILSTTLTAGFGALAFPVERGEQL